MGKKNIGVIVMSDLALTNIMALASREADGVFHLSTGCYKIFYITILILLLGSCKQRSHEVERVNLTPEVISDELFISRYSQLVKTSNHFYVCDVKEKDGFIKIYNPDGSFNQSIGKIGNGPEEFTTPYMIPYKKDGILTWNKWGRFNSAISQNTENGMSLSPISIHFINDSVASLQTDLEGNFIAYNPTKKDGIITLYSKEGKEIASAGKLPYPQEISNKQECFSGNIMYNPYNKKLVLALNQLPYAAVYQIKNNKITFLNEQEMGKAEYNISDNSMNIPHSGKDCLVGFCLTDDYIVSILNDPDYKEDDRSQTSPKRNTVGVYDYNLNLIKIVNLNMPRINLAAQGNDNCFYSIVLNPEYSIVKVDL